MSWSSENDIRRQMIYVMFYNLLLYTMITLWIIIVLILLAPIWVFFWNLKTSNIRSQWILFVSIILSVIVWILWLVWATNSDSDWRILDAENVFEQHINCLDRVDYDIQTTDDAVDFAYDLNMCDMNLIDDVERYYDRYY